MDLLTRKDGADFPPGIRRFLCPRRGEIPFSRIRHGNVHFAVHALYWRHDGPSWIITRHVVRAPLTHGNAGIFREIERNGWRGGCGTPQERFQKRPSGQGLRRKEFFPACGKIYPPPPDPDSKHTLGAAINRSWGKLDKHTFFPASGNAHRSTEFSFFIEAGHGFPFALCSVKRGEPESPIRAAHPPARFSAYQAAQYSKHGMHP